MPPIPGHSCCQNQTRIGLDVSSRQNAGPCSSARHRSHRLANQYCCQAGGLGEKGRFGLQGLQSSLGAFCHGGYLVCQSDLNKVNARRKIEFQPANFRTLGAFTPLVGVDVSNFQCRASLFWIYNDEDCLKSHKFLAVLSIRTKSQSDRKDRQICPRH